MKIGARVFATWKTEDTIEDKIELEGFFFCFRNGRNERNELGRYRRRTNGITEDFGAVVLTSERTKRG